MMERCKSCLQFEMKNTHNNNNNSNICHYNSSDEIMTTSNSLKSISIRQSYKLRQQQQQQQQQQQKEMQNFGKESSESLNLMAIRSTAAFIASISANVGTTVGTTTNRVMPATNPATPTTTSATSVTIPRNILPRYTSSTRSKKQLHRQASNRHCTDSDYHDAEADYHADLEDDAPELQPEKDHERILERSERTPAFVQSYHRQLQFALNKPQSDSMLMTHTALQRSRLKHEDSFDSVATIDQSSLSQRRQRFAAQLGRDSCQSMSHSDSSRYSSVDSLLESRKPDPEAILINLGFGPVGSEDILSRIPKRFLKPSQVRGIDTEAFVRRLQLANHLADHSVLGYRGLTGNPDVPPSSIVAKIMERFEVNQRKKSMGGIE